MNQQHEWSALGRIDLNLFRVFEVIYRERNLTRAAALLHLSQSAVSHALNRLREQLDDPLFIREGRGVAPTPLATQLAPGIQEALAGLLRSVTRGQDFDPTQDRRTFTLNMPEQMEPVVLPSIIDHLRRVAPQLQVRSSSLHWAAMGALASPGDGPGAAFRRPTEGYRYFVMLLDVPSRTVQLGIVHPDGVPASISELLPAFPATVSQMTIDAVRALRLPN